MAIKGYASNPLKAGESLRADNIILTLEADDAITKGIFVELVTGGHCKAADATVGGPVGIALGSGVDGSFIQVLVAGIGSVTADATGVTIGDFIKPDANGKADVATYATDDIVALALSNSGAGGVAAVLLQSVSLDTNT